MSDATAEGPIDVRAPGPGIARSLALCLVFYVVFIAAMIPAEFFRQALAPGIDYFSTMVIPQIIAWFVTIRLGLQWSGVPLTTACPLRPFPLRIVPALLVASYGATILLLEMAGWIPMPESFRQGMVQQMAQANWLLFLLPVVVVAPVAEEMFFRGLLLRGYLARYSVTTAIWGSAILFALFHLNPWQALIALPLGVAYAWLALRTGSVLPSMLSHAMVNFSTNFLLQPLAAVLGYSAAQLQEARHFPPLMLGIGAVLTVAGCYVISQQLGRGTVYDSAVVMLEPASTSENEFAGGFPTTTIDLREKDGLAGERAAP
jgi:membrane protease YdiL (CAAX protease family)